MCEPLLEPESSEDSWQVVVAMSLDHNYTRLKSVDGAVDGERQATLLEVSNRFPPGWFACSVVAGAQQQWQSYLEANRRGKETAQKNPKRKSFTKEIDELKAKKQRLQADVDTLTKTADRLSEQAETTGNLTFTVDGRPRLRSFGERETVASPAESATPCVTPQPLGIKPEDIVTLKVHGISEAGPEIKEELVQVLQNRMDDAVLEVLSVMLARNPMCKLTPDDVHFIQKPFHAPDSIIQDYSQPETSNKRVSEKDIFVYNQSTTSGNKGIACIALAVVDTQGHTIQHSNYAKPFITAYKKELKPDDFAALTSTIINKSDCAFKELSSQALMEFRIWKQGRVNIESLTQKLGNAVRHALWDLLMEYRLLTTPIPEIQFLPSSEPTTPNKGCHRHRKLGVLRETYISFNFWFTFRSTDLADFVILERLFTLESHSILLPIGREKTETTLHEVYHTIMQPWLDFGVELGVPSIRKHTVSLTARHSLAVMLKEMQMLIISNAPDTHALVFCPSTIPVSGNKQTYLACQGLNTIKELIPHSEEGSTCLVLGRNFNQWQACIIDANNYDADILNPKVSRSCPSQESGCVAASTCVPFDGERPRSDLAKVGVSCLQDVFYDNKPGKPMKHFIKTLNMDPVSRNAQQFLRTQQQDRKDGVFSQLQLETIP
uniref:Uncharacterized protein n=1 Tax=Timema poppense TaxID=170557 RepID=A0A7R9CZJ8_TIMPO|nr:unnamed protein product [Timema poppensis]